MTQDIHVGIDIGGSHIGIGYLNLNGELLRKVEEPINGLDIEGMELVLKVVDTVRRNNTESWNIRSIGIGCPGQAKNGIVVAASNFPKISNLNIVQELTSIFGDIPIVLLNDADAVMAAEVWGTHKEFYQHIRNAVVFTLGTGIGCGMLLDGKLFRGHNGLVEAGHMIVTNAADARLCGCGQRGCVEAYASASSTTLRLKELDNSNFLSLFGSPAEPTGTKDVFQRYFNKDPNAVQVVEETAAYLAILCINICRVVDPEIIVFSGGMANVGQPLLDLIQKHMRDKTWTVLPTSVHLAVAKSASDNGIIGAALAAAQHVAASCALPAVSTNIDDVPLPAAATATDSSEVEMSNLTHDVSTALRDDCLNGHGGVEGTSTSGSVRSTVVTLGLFGGFVLTVSCGVAATMLLQQNLQLTSGKNITWRYLSQLITDNRFTPAALHSAFIVTGQTIVGIGFACALMIKT